MRTQPEVWSMVVFNANGESIAWLIYCHMVSTMLFALNCGQRCILKLAVATQDLLALRKANEASVEAAPAWGFQVFVSSAVAIEEDTSKIGRGGSGRASERDSREAQDDTRRIVRTSRWDPVFPFLPCFGARRAIHSGTPLEISLIRSLSLQTRSAAKSV
jgi:hypothetical protein